MANDEATELQLTCFEIISYVGSAKSKYVEAVRAAEQGDFEGAAALIKEGDGLYVQGHNAHMKLLQKDAAGESDGKAPLILLHAEDQMANAETTKLLAENCCDIYKRLAKLEA